MNPWNKILSRIVSGRLHHNGVVLAGATVEARMKEYAYRDLFKSLIAMQDRRHTIWGTPEGLAAALNMDLGDLKEAMARLMAPDPNSRNQEHEGRRVVEIPGGYMLTGGESVVEDTGGDRTEYFRNKKREQRAAARQNGVAPAQTPTQRLWSLNQQAMACKDRIRDIDMEPSNWTRGERGKKQRTPEAAVQIAELETKLKELTRAMTEISNPQTPTTPQ